MTSFWWATRALVLLAAPLALALPVLAQDDPQSLAVPPMPSTIKVPQPQALQTGEETPWLYRGSDVPVDEEWLFGEMDNGLRYAVRRNGVPPGQVSIRVRIDAGSLHERDEALLETLEGDRGSHLGGHVVEEGLGEGHRRPSIPLTGGRGDRRGGAGAWAALAPTPPRPRPTRFAGARNRAARGARGPI